MRPALLYPLLVGLPILGVVAILRVGERITPPPALGGAWTVERGAGAGEPPELLVPCGAARQRRAFHGADVEQSGTTATVVLRDAAGARWAEGSVVLRGDAGAADGMLTLAGCGATTMHVTLVPDGTLRPQLMDISLAVQDCADTDCATVNARVTHEVRRTTTSTAPGH